MTFAPVESAASVSAHHPSTARLCRGQKPVQPAKIVSGFSSGPPALFAQKIDAKCGSEGFGEEQQVSGNRKDCARWAGRLC